MRLGPHKPLIHGQLLEIEWHALPFETSAAERTNARQPRIAGIVDGRKE
jgi:hypothetical protein